MLTTGTEQTMGLRTDFMVLKRTLLAFFAIKFEIFGFCLTNGILIGS